MFSQRQKWQNFKYTPPPRARWLSLLLSGHPQRRPSLLVDLVAAQLHPEPVDRPLKPAAQRRGRLPAQQRFGLVHVGTPSARIVAREQRPLLGGRGVTDRCVHLADLALSMLDFAP